MIDLLDRKVILRPILSYRSDIINSDDENILRDF